MLLSISCVLKLFLLLRTRQHSSWSIAEGSQIVRHLPAPHASPRNFGNSEKENFLPPQLKVWEETKKYCTKQTFSPILWKNLFVFSQVPMWEQDPMVIYLSFFSSSCSKYHNVLFVKIIYNYSRRKWKDMVVASHFTWIISLWVRWLSYCCFWGLILWRRFLVLLLRNWEHIFLKQMMSCFRLSWPRGNKI